MKKLLIAAVALSTLSVSVTAQAGPKMSRTMENSLVKVCEALQSDNRLRLHRTIERHGFTYRQIAQGIRCNGQDAVTFALSNNANVTAKFMARKAHVDIDTLLAKR